MRPSLFALARPSNDGALFAAAAAFAAVVCGCGSPSPASSGESAATRSPGASTAGSPSSAGATAAASGASSSSSAGSGSGGASPETAAPKITLLASAGAIVPVEPPTSSNDNSAILSWNAVNATSCTASGAWSGAKSTFGGCHESANTGMSSPSCNTDSTAFNTGSFAYSTSGDNTYKYTLSCTGPGGTSEASTSITVYAPGTTPDLTGKCGGTSHDRSWVYHDGLFAWPGDFTVTGATIDYSAKAGAPLTGPFDIHFQQTVDWSLWLPYSQNWDFYVGGCDYLTFAVKPNASKPSWQTYFMMVGDLTEAKNPDGTESSINYLVVGSGANTSTNSQTHATTSLPAYGPTDPVPGAWSVYKIPLTAFFAGEVPTSIYKFAIQDESGTLDDWYIDDVGFTGK